MSNSLATDAALQAIQKAVKVLAEWERVEVVLPAESKNCPSVHKVTQDILPWPEKAKPQALRVLFDRVKLEKGQTEKHYWPAKEIEAENPRIPYPQKEIPDLTLLKQQVKEVLGTIEQDPKQWENLSRLTLILEKFGSYLSFGGEDIALVDWARSTAAVAAALAENPDATQVSLVAGNISGIQNFIYTISSDGALKSLRARSFYLELITQEIVLQLLEALNLPQTNVIYAGGGNLYLLASGDEAKVNQKIQQIREQFNNWLKNTFRGKLFLSLGYSILPIEALKTKEISDYWTKVTKDIGVQKRQKFSSDLNSFIQPKISYEPCRVCYRNDLPSLKPLSREQDASRACWVCRNMFELGNRLFNIKAVVRSKRSNIRRGKFERVYLPPKSYYYFFQSLDEAIQAANQESDTILLINNWDLEHYQNPNTRTLLLGNYGKRSEENDEDDKQPRFMRAEEFAAKSQGISRVGYLRMDVDNLGRIFAKGLGEKQTLPRLAGLSRLMSYFFKVYLNSLAEYRLQNNAPAAKVLSQNDERKNLLFIYAGGDDLFVSGSWNEVVEFAFDIYQSFRAYTGQNPDITLSGGISIDDVKFPLYQAATASGEAEDSAKNNGRDSLGLFGRAFKWYEWLGVDETTEDNQETRNYLSNETKPELFGILPFVDYLNAVNINYSRNFIRNLLLVAELQEKMVEEIKEKYPEKEQEFRHYLHLPKVAYTLARLPKEIRDHPNFTPVRTSLKNPYNAPYFRAIATWLELSNRS